MNPKTTEFREKVAKRFVECLMQEGMAWKNKWNMVEVPQNAATGNYYRGINRFFLKMYLRDNDIRDPRFATFSQIRENGWHLQKGAKGIQVEYWMPYDSIEKKVLSWKDYQEMSPEYRMECRLISKYFYVFSAKDINGLPEWVVPKPKDIEEDTIIPTIARNMQIEILHDGEDRAFYRPSEDKIHLPTKEAFLSDYDYNSVVLHELSHATGAPARLNRGIDNMKHSASYAYEELVAEISSTFMGEDLSCVCSDYQMDNHVAYIQSWIKEIENKPDMLIRAIRDAERAADYLQYKAELLPEQEYKKRMGQTMEVELDRKEHVIQPDENGYKMQNEVCTVGNCGTRFPRKGRRWKR